MTLDGLLAGYHAGGGYLSGDKLTEYAGTAWGLLCGESRGRVTEVEAETAEGRLVQQCFSQMVETAAEEAAPALQSEVLGQWHRTYAVTEKQAARRLKALMRQYLGETGLLYRGWPG